MIKIGFPETNGQWLKFFFDLAFWVSWILMLLWIRDKEILCQDYCKNICPEFEPFLFPNTTENRTFIKWNISEPPQVE